MLLESLRAQLDAMGVEGLDDSQVAMLLDSNEDISKRIIAQFESERASERFEKFKFIFPDDTVKLGETIWWARRHYKRHLAFFEAGAKYRERCFMAANRVGKTLSGGGYEIACHLTGRYPTWWEGKRFRHPIRAWACGKTNETTRDIVQDKLLGEIGFIGNRKIVDGSGIVPRDAIMTDMGSITWKSGVADLVDTIKIRHVSGGISKLGLKSYNQGRGAFEGMAMHVIWDDEEPPMDVWNEQLLRLATTKGIMMLTFTPLEGISEVVEQFLPTEMRPSRLDDQGKSDFASQWDRLGLS